MKEYNKLSDNEKIDLIKDLYENHKKSFGDIAKDLNTYANKIRRDAIKFNIKIRDKSSAQKNALSSGKHKHPTKGTKRDNETKQKIGLGVLSSWESMSEDELNERKNRAKDQWQTLTDDQKSVMQRKANEAVRKTSKEGSKLEKFILEQLISDGYKVQFHQEQTLSNTKLQLDLVIPSINVAIEIDGPSHFAPVWGDDALSRNKRYDQKKEGLIIGKGFSLIRIKQTKDFSKSRSLIIYNELKQLLKSISDKTVNDKTFTIED